ncbi:exopolygalacturonase-like [Manihot esculenta]|uniref:exopolygalacturonase-like n=1 Tax=Manihot esculenta TaxID=3983 RepID=UPI001CC79BF1|nr:exopolygalacturonase-like [Manihot esculenta]
MDYRGDEHISSYGQDTRMLLFVFFVFPFSIQSARSLVGFRRVVRHSPAYTHYGYSRGITDLLAGDIPDQANDHIIIGLSENAIFISVFLQLIELSVGVAAVGTHHLMFSFLQALLGAWKEACSAKGSNIVVVPKGTYSIGLTDLNGPCKGAMELQVQGTLLAPINPSSYAKDSWITFAYIDQFKLSGGGTFDGQGQVAWKQNNCGRNPKCKRLPVYVLLVPLKTRQSLRFDFITNSVVQDVTSLDSKNFHVNLLGGKNLTFDRFTITAPGDSVNTDGIHIGHSNGINIINSNIATGDDCISIGGASEQIRITNVRCGHGHGISVGSLGKTTDEFVSGIFVRNCTFYDTDNGVRIKTWPALHGGMASDMHFEDIMMKNVRNPIIIDQMYCPWNQCNPKVTRKEMKMKESLNALSVDKSARNMKFL